MIRTIISRLKEPSSWAGLAMFVAYASGKSLDPGTAQDIGMMMAAAMAALSIVLPERK